MFIRLGHLQFLINVKKLFIFSDDKRTIEIVHEHVHVRQKTTNTFLMKTLVPDIATYL